MGPLCPGEEAEFPDGAVMRGSVATFQEQARSLKISTLGKQAERRLMKFSLPKSTVKY